MKLVIQRTASASVKTDGHIAGSIGKGLLVLVGVMKGDTEKDAAAAAAKTVKMRIFEDENGKMNLALADVGGSLLAVSNFTLCADCTHGNRPDFFGSAPPAEAKRLYEYFITCVGNAGIHTESGVFGADMKVSLVNDGPVTVMLDSRDLITEKDKHNTGEAVK